MGYATTRSMERVAAAMGQLQQAPIRFEAAQDVTGGGVLLALPALLVMGLLETDPPDPPTAEGLLRNREHLPFAGADGIGTDRIGGATAL